MSLASSKAITWQQQYFNPPVYYYPTKSHRHTLINGYESRSTNHEAFLDQAEQIAYHTQKGIDYLDKYGAFLKERAAIEDEYAAKLRRRASATAVLLRRRPSTKGPSAEAMAEYRAAASVGGHSRRFGKYHRAAHRARKKRQDGRETSWGPVVQFSNAPIEWAGRGGVEYRAHARSVVRTPNRQRYRHRHPTPRVHSPTATCTRGRRVAPVVASIDAWARRPNAHLCRFSRECRRFGRRKRRNPFRASCGLSGTPPLRSSLRHSAFICTRLPTFASALFADRNVTLLKRRRRRRVACAKFDKASRPVPTVLCWARMNQQPVFDRVAPSCSLSVWSVRRSMASVGGEGETRQRMNGASWLPKRVEGRSPAPLSRKDGRRDRRCVVLLLVGRSAARLQQCASSSRAASHLV
uniref:FCH domain-containing protein n=1 Tax=Plectus sambesii TaxID=2011161 RepID=A0A914WB54_9BILA